MIDFINEFIDVNSSVYESIDYKITNCFAIDNVFVKKFLTIDDVFMKEFLTIDDIVMIDKNTLNLISFNILT